MLRDNYTTKVNLFLSLALSLSLSLSLSLISILSFHIFHKHADKQHSNTVNICTHLCRPSTV